MMIGSNMLYKIP